MTALIRGLQIQVPKGTYYQKTSDGWIKHENNIQYMAKEGKFGPQSTLAQNK